MKITVTTPTGHVGQAVTEKLLEAGAELTLIARSPKKVKEFAKRGARVVEGSLEDPAVVQKATEGADALFWVTPVKFDADDFRAFQNTLADIVARVAHSRPEMHVVNLSSVGAHLSEGTGPIKGLHDVEEKLDEATRRLTHLRPTYFMENVLQNLPTIVEHGAIFSTVPAAALMNQVATADVAGIAAEILLGPAPDEPRVIHVMGPEEITFARAAEIVSEATGKQVKHVEIPGDQLRHAIQEMGASADVANQLVEMEDAFRRRLTVPPDGAEIRTGSTSLRKFAGTVLAGALDHASAASA